jgi:3-phosphoshikimate 1-carboxyvinyltransferase
VTHRALVAAALADGPTTLVDPLDSDDTRTTLEGLRALGFETSTDPSGWTVVGRGGEVPGGGDIELRESGTSFRFLTALASLGARPSSLDGAPRLRARPVAELAEAIRSLGGTVELPSTGSLPLRAGGTRPRGGAVEIAADRSSQFASALLLIGHRLERGLRLRLTGTLVSRPYVDVTARVLRDFGVEIRSVGSDLETSHARIQGLTPYRIEGDHSSASYLFAAAAVTGGRVRVDGLRPDSAQPDASFTRRLADLGCAVERGEDWIEVAGTDRIPGFDLDLSQSPDLAPTWAVLGLFAEDPSRLAGVAHLRIKESDRLAVLAANLNALGRGAVAGPDELRIGPPPPAGLYGTTIRTDSDHRMAMAFAVAGLRVPGVVIDDAGCVGKSWPGFWEVFAELEG